VGTGKGCGRGRPDGRRRRVARHTQPCGRGCGRLASSDAHAQPVDLT
jgi:hypothetical protein